MDRDNLTILLMGNIDNDYTYYRNLLINDYAHNYTLEAVATVEQALNLVKETPIDCLLLQQKIFSKVGMVFIEKMALLNHSDFLPFVLLPHYQADALVARVAVDTPAERLLTQISADKLRKLLEAALDNAIVNQSDAYHCFDYTLSTQEQLQVKTVIALEEAITRQELSLRYQPIFNLSNHEISGFELLLRWEHPQIDIFGPRSFIPLAERSGLMLPIGEWSIKKALQDFNAWRNLNLNLDSKLYVKLLPSQLQDELWLEQLSELAVISGITTKNIVLEISAKILQHEMTYYRTVLNQLSDWGFSLCVRGVGSTSGKLDYLKDFKIDSVKISQSLVRVLESEPVAVARLKMVMQQCAQLDYMSIGVGIETEGQMKILKKQHCQQGQGYLLCYPLETEGVNRLLGQQAPTAKKKRQVKK